MPPKRKENIVAIITTRQGSKRLPDKANADIGGVSMTRRIVDELNRAGQIDIVIVATDSTSHLEGVHPGYQGSDTDVLDRLCKAAELYHADIIVRVWGDSPLIDHRLIDPAIREFKKSEADYARTDGLPAGMRFTLIRRKALVDAVSQMSVKDRAIWNKVDEDLIWYLLPCSKMVFKSNADFSHIKLDVDTQEDLELVRSIFAGEGDV